MPVSNYYYREIKHDGLNKYRIVKASTQYELNQKTAAITAQWNEQWDKKLQKEKRIKN